MSRRALLPLLLLLAYALFIFAPLIADPDLWGHVRFGQDMLQAGRIPQADPYSYLTAGQTWVNHEWLSEVSQALAYQAAGARGIITLNLCLALVTLAALFSRLIARGMGPYGAALLLAGVALLLRAGVLTARPQVFTYLLFTLLLLVIESAESNDSRAVSRPLLTLPILVVWVNVHGGVLAGVGALYVWGIVHLFEAARRAGSWRGLLAPRHRAVALTLLLAPFALLVNPYGADLLAFLLRTATSPRPEIADWEPARLGNTWSQLWLAGVALTAVAIALSRRPRCAALLLPLAIIAALPLLSIRHIPLFAVAAPALAPSHFAGLWDRAAGPLSRRAPRWIAAWLLPAGTAAAAVILLILAPPRLGSIAIEPAVAEFPARAVDALRQAGLRGNMAVEFNWGEYVIWHLGPGIRVSVDGRRETVYPDAIYRENLDFMRGEGDWDRLVDRPETEFALVDRTRPVYRLMREKPGWSLAHEDRTAAVFARVGSPALEWLADVEPPPWPEDGAGMTFPVRGSS